MGLHVATMQSPQIWFFSGPSQFPVDLDLSPRCSLLEKPLGVKHRFQTDSKRKGEDVDSFDKLPCPNSF